MWRAAVAGVSWAIEVAGAQATCTVTDVDWVPLDTNPTLVAIAAARAVWTALQFTPEASLAARIEEAIISSWQVPDGQLGLPPYDRQGNL